MNKEIVNLPRAPSGLQGRLNTQQAAPILGVGVHDMPVLVRAKLIKPLGNPARCSVKFFAASDIEQCAASHDWLNRATKAIYRHWAGQNKKRHAAKHGVIEPSGSVAV